ncbi:piggyBac transposable element-derived protein 4-like [Aphis craccivora]|uniref:PiggyBac transposable element-derived protein 4-like n=1 Tax=Aphis craccivora TaxID=307492 RepID=A0A6G0W2V6_APHCR|nr:piggyBac transposable element-derived protein 4-like [Aphis craccivora]
MNKTLRANRKNSPQEVIKKKLNKGEMIQRFTQEGTCIMKWRDRRDVLVISTEYDGTLVEEIYKKGNKITKPKAILQCNKFMGAIDHSDQIYSRSKLNLYEFRLSVIETLIKEGLETTLAPRFILQPKTRNHYPKMVERNEKKNRRCQACIKTKIHLETDIYFPTCPGEPGLSVYPCFKNYHQ